MKYVCLSFDDGRKDTFLVALPILEKYKFKATVNIINDYSFKNKKGEDFGFKTSDIGMTIDDIVMWNELGHEVACHGKSHKNSIEDIRLGIAELKKRIPNLKLKKIGFASPKSELDNNLIKVSGIDKLYNNKFLLYIRSGIRIKKQGIIYVLLSILERITKNKKLFYLLQKNNIMNINKLPLILKSIAIKNFTKLDEIIEVIEKMKDDECVILMFHSILDKKDKGYGMDCWYWDKRKFEILCKYLSDKKINVLTIEKLIEIQGEENRWIY